LPMRSPRLQHLAGVGLLGSQRRDAIHGLLIEDLASALADDARGQPRLAVWPA
jgi:hypothetical protein